MFVVVCPRAEVHYDEEAYKQRAIELKRQRLKAIEEKDAKKEKELHEQEDTSVMSNLMNKVIRNFELRIDEIHIRYEDHSSDPKHPFCGGVCLHSIIVSPNKENTSEEAEGSAKPVQHNGVFTKDILIDRFGVYWDSDSKYQVNTSNAIALTRDMEYAFSRPAGDVSKLPVPTHFIVHPLSLDVLLHIDIRGVELRKPTPEQAALSAMKELGWNQEVLVNQKFMKAYAKIKRDGIRGRSEKEETELFIAKFKDKYPKFCSSVNLQFAAEFAALCWKYANTASPIVVASATLPQLTVTVLQSQIRDAATLLANLSLQSKRAQQSFDRPEKSVAKAPRAWWRYAIQCVKKQAREKRVSTSWEDYLRFKKQRNEYIVLYKRSIHAQGYQSLKKDKKAQRRKQELEDLFSLENTVLFRKMARMEIEREGGIDSSESSSEEELRAELYKDVEVSDEDMNPWEGGQPRDVVLSADFMLGSAQVVLKREEEKLVDVILERVCVQAYKRKEYAELWFMMDDVKVLDSSPFKTRYKEIVVVNKAAATAVATPRDDEEAEGANTSILPANFRGAATRPFLQGHVELPALDNQSDVRVQAQVQSLDVVVNVEWLLELVKFLVPSNAVNMSAYEEKAYNLVTALRNGDANVASTILKNRGFSLDVSLQPINVIIPDSCSAHRSKTNLLLCQLGEIAVTSRPRQPVADASLITPQDAYNSIDVAIHDVAIGFVGGRVFASHARESNLVTRGFEDTLLVKPFDVDMKVGLCLVNEVRSASMTLDVAVRPIVLNVTRTVISMAMGWAVPILTSFASKQKELDLDVLSLLLLPKQLLFSCIEYDGSILAADHDTKAWADSPDRLHRTLYKVLNASQASAQGEAQALSPTVPPARMTATASLEEEHAHGVVHLSYEDLVLLQYKPSMAIHLTVEKVAVEVFHPADAQKKLLALELDALTMDYLDHMYDMDIALKVPSFSLVDYACPASGEGRLLEGSSDPAAPFLSVRFASIGELSMMNEAFNAATVVMADLGPISGTLYLRE